MSTSPDTIAHILDTLHALPLSARKMFGEYALYLDGKVVALVCDDTLFVKPTAGATVLLPDAQMAPAYHSGKPMIMASELLDDADFLGKVLRQVALDAPPPKAKAVKKPKPVSAP